MAISRKQLGARLGKLARAFQAGWVEGHRLTDDELASIQSKAEDQWVQDHPSAPAGEDSPELRRQVPPKSSVAAPSQRVARSGGTEQRARASTTLAEDFDLGPSPVAGPSSTPMAEPSLPCEPPVKPTAKRRRTKGA